MGLAAKLRQRVATDRRPGSSPRRTWAGTSLAPELVGDANHALKAAFELEDERRRLAPG